jgi:glycosyltransferase involved in cell wall biosynthesis
MTLVEKTARSRSWGGKRLCCRVSVVVPTCKRLDLLKRCLQALMQQDIDPTCYEVIVVDDAACDDTRQLVEHFAKREASCPPIRYVAVSGKRGPAAARNLGWRAAHGEIIAFTDDDCIPTPGWLRAGLAAFAPGIIGVSGKLIVPLPDHPTDYERNAAHLETSEFITANCFYRRECLAAVGGFDERFTIAWREDSDLMFMLHKHASAMASIAPPHACIEPTQHEGRGDACHRTGIPGCPGIEAFAFAHDAVVIHPVRPAHWGISVRQQRKSMFNALLYKKHPQLYREKIQAAPPWRYYGIAGALLVALLALLNKKQGLAFAAFCLWAMLTGRFCLQRLESTSHDPHHVTEMIVTSALIPPLSIYWRMHGAIKFRVFFL